MWDNDVFISIHFAQTLLMCRQLQRILGLADQHAHASGPLIVFGCVVKEKYKESSPCNVYLLILLFFLLQVKGITNIYDIIHS